MDLMSGIPARYGRNALSDYQPEIAVHLRTQFGNTWFVDSNVRISGGNGASWSGAVSTVAAAVALANPGDLILVAPGHAETISTAAGLALSKANVDIIGLGKGAYRPTLTLSAVAATVEIAGASVRLENFLFLVTDDVTSVLNIKAVDAQVVRCEFRTNTTTNKEWVNAITVGSSANNADRALISECVFQANAAGANAAIELGTVQDRVSIVGCIVMGDYADACIHNPTGNVLTRLLVLGCHLENTQTGDHAIELVSACTGILARNLYKSDLTQATASDPGSCFSYENYHDDVIDTSAIISPAVT